MSPTSALHTCSRTPFRVPPVHPKKATQPRCSVLPSTKPRASGPTRKRTAAFDEARRVAIIGPPSRRLTHGVDSSQLDVLPREPLAFVHSTMRDTPSNAET